MKKTIDYSALERDLRTAFEAAAKVKLIQGDVGTCNTDSVSLTLPHARLAKVQAAARAAGATAYRGRFAGEFHIHPPSGAQGAENTKRAELMVSMLKAQGWDASVHYMID